MRSFLAAPLPVWARQIDSARADADGKVAELARAAGDFLRRLDDVVGRQDFAATGGTQQDFAGALARTASEVDALVAALHAAQDSKQRVVTDIGAEAQRLQDHAAEIRKIAMHTRMVTLNATIEAARAGGAGRPFATIVADMNGLASRTAQTSEEFSRTAAHLYRLVEAAFRESPEADAADDRQGGAESTERLVRDVVERFRAMADQLQASRRAMEEERAGLRDEISSVLVALQFQDRVSQILAHVTEHLERMRMELHEAEARALDPKRWLEGMAAIYSTAEEFANHAGRPAARAAASAEVTYF